MIDTPPPPPAVIEFAQKSGYSESILPFGTWKSFNVYIPDSKKEKGDWGLPQFIIQNGSTIRWADDDEQDEILNRK